MSDLKAKRLKCTKIDFGWGGEDRDGKGRKRRRWDEKKGRGPPCVGMAPPNG